MCQDKLGEIVAKQLAAGDANHNPTAGEGERLLNSEMMKLVAMPPQKERDEEEKGVSNSLHQ